MSLRLVIADDEPIALAHLRSLVATHADVTIVGEARDGADAVDLIRRLQPDAVVLDIQMPEIDGFGVLRVLGSDWHGHVIFATAYDSFAVSAFERRALDYVLKPVAPERLADSISRLRAATERIGAQAQGADLQAQRAGTQALLAEVAPPALLERLAVSHQGRSVVVAIDSVEWIEAENNYVRLHCGTQNHLLRGKLTTLEARLDPRQFMRVHRSHIVRLDCIQRLDEWTRGTLLLVLRSGASVEVSRAYRQRLMARLTL